MNEDAEVEVEVGRDEEGGRTQKRNPKTAPRTAALKMGLA